MSLLEDVDWPQAWERAPLWSMFQRVKDVGHPDEQMLSVYRDHGVVRKDDRTDNFNKTALNRDIYQLIDDGWLALNRMKAWQGAVGISTLRGIVSGHYICFRPTHHSEPRFLHYLIRSPIYTAEMQRISRGVRPSQIEIDNDQLRVLQLRLPSLDLQRRIADFLDAETARIDALIAAKQRMVDGLIASRMDTMRAGVAGEGVSGDRSKASLAWLPELPTHWGTAKLTLLARLGSGHTPSRSHPEWWMDPTIPWITTGEVAQMRSDRIEVIQETREMISELGMANSSAELHPARTVVLCRTASAGYSAIMGRPMAVSQDFATWTCGPHLDPRFLLLCLRAMRRDLLERLAMGSTHKTIYMPDIESIRVPVPPMDEQHGIVEWVWSRLRRTDTIVDTLTAQITLLRERRHALITAAVTGEIEV